ncbi:electron transfer flavoprotein subunit beta [Azospirillum melinis]|uniref:Electron transfer flavoprotein subunit beta n=1 Tax=Azospirillum melinis TaxID=328839 RepID=A0ABX2K5A5_9PROT|nr:electron transfer flavoprotein subunit beta [Azospirillum melinis]MBP2305299.1 electron transfer flavoprotein beta subunit [Azospirillum melinis]NUA97765.1 electron transfer flavoprotein subunit beta [Azospirillum melinis]
MTEAATNDVAVLLSIGRHPVSGRARRAATDAQALEMALALRPKRLTAIHAGPAADADALRAYLGMGLERLTVLVLPEDADPVEPLIAHLRRLAPSLVLTGRQAEDGEGSGMLPYLIARGLEAAVVSDVVRIGPSDAPDYSASMTDLVQALPRGQRRALTVTGRLIATVHPSAPPARASAFGPARRGVIEPVAAQATADLFLSECEHRPWRPKPKLMRVKRGGSALDRLKAATESKSGKGQLLVNPTPEAGALAIYDSLVEQGMLP